MYNIPELLQSDTFRADLRRALDPALAPPVLRDAKIKITSRCNLRCVMCDYWRTTREDALSTARWFAVFAELAELGCRKIHFSGGEVFLRPDFLDLVERAIGCGIKSNLTTNGTLVGREHVRRMADLGVNGVSISLDGPGPTTHDRIRGRDNAFKRSVKTIERLRRSAPDIKVRINCVVMRSNFRRLPRMVALAGELGVTELLPMPVDEKGARKRRLSRAQILEYNRDVAPAVAALRQRYGFSLDPAHVYPFGVTEREVAHSAKGLYARGFFTRRTCFAPWMHTFLAWNGDTYLCCMTNGRIESLGNVGRNRVREVFEGDGYRRIRGEFLAGRHLPECHRCDLFLRENAALHAALEAAGPVST